MIRIITDENIIDKEMLNKSYYGRKVLSYLMAYGVKYDFCKFYLLEYDDVWLFVPYELNNGCVYGGRYSNG